MRSARALIVLATVLILNSISMAALTSAVINNSGGTDAGMTGWGPINSTPLIFDDFWLDIAGDQWGNGGVTGTFETDTAEDPILLIQNIVDNDTAFAWSGYNVLVSLSQNFTLSAAQVNTPSGWSALVTAPTFNVGNSLWEGLINFTGGPNIPVGGSLDFQFQMAFAGATTYTFSETLSPVAVPEPAGLGAIVCGAALLIRRRRAS